MTDMARKGTETARRSTRKAAGTARKSTRKAAETAKESAGKAAASVGEAATSAKASASEAAEKGPGSAKRAVGGVRHRVRLYRRSQAQCRPSGGEEAAVGQEGLPAAKEVVPIGRRADALDGLGFGSRRVPTRVLSMFRVSIRRPSNRCPRGRAPHSVDRWAARRHGRRGSRHWNGRSPKESVEQDVVHPTTDDVALSAPLCGPRPAGARPRGPEEQAPAQVAPVPAGLTGREVVVEHQRVCRTA